MKNKLKNMKFKTLNFKSIAQMLYTSFLSIVAFMIIILVISFLSASMTNKKADRITEEQLPNILLYTEHIFCILFKLLVIIGR